MRHKTSKIQRTKKNTKRNELIINVTIKNNLFSVQGCQDVSKGVSFVN